MLVMSAFGCTKFAFAAFSDSKRENISCLLPDWLYGKARTLEGIDHKIRWQSNASRMVSRAMEDV